MNDEAELAKVLAKWRQWCNVSEPSGPQAVFPS